MTESKSYPIPTQQYIHGQWVDGKGEAVKMLSSVDDSVVVEALSWAGAEEVDEAVASAEKGLVAWQKMPPQQRRTVLLKFADLVQENADKLAYLEAILTGKPVSSSKSADVPSLVDSLQYFAGFIDKNDGDLHVHDDGFMRGVIHQPFGVTAAIVPFNFPLGTTGSKIGPGLAAGNAIILKASERNPFSTLCLGDLAVQAGLPPGTLNVLVGGPECGQALSSHMKIRKISFTGNPGVGRAIQIAAAKSNLKRVTLELGGKSPVIVFADADIGIAIRYALAFTALNGQACVVGTRIYVQESIADPFLQGLKRAVEGMAASLGGSPFDPKTYQSPLYHHRQKEIVLRYLDLGKDEAELIAGGEAWGDKGCYIKPTIYFHPKKDAKILKEEIFGPVAVVDTFKTEEEVLEKANDTEYGLGAYVYTSDVSRAIRLSKALEAGTVAVNTPMPTHSTIPFGGWKGSGLGQENSKYALRCWTQPKSVVIKFEPSAKA